MRSTKIKVFQPVTIDIPLTNAGSKSRLLVRQEHFLFEIVKLILTVCKLDMPSGPSEHSGLNRKVFISIPVCIFFLDYKGRVCCHAKKFLNFS